MFPEAGWPKSRYLQTWIFKVVFDLNRCGSKIFFDFFVRDYPEMEKYREFSNVINDRDLWINKDPRGEIFQNLHHMYDDELFVKRMLENDSFDLSHDEQLLLDFQKRKSDQYQKFLLQTIGNKNR